MTKRKRGLAKVVNKNTKIMIIGSFPSEISLKRKEYYANPRNQFWKIVSALLKVDVQNISYEKKLKLLLKNCIGLWDSIDSCKRQGSQDMTITCERLNDFEVLFEEYPGIKVVFCNGKKAYKSFSTFFRLGVKVVCLPSSSSAHAIPFKDKVKKWKKIKKF